jgi:hypothetical protein
MIRRISIVVAIVIVAGAITWRALHLSDLAFIGAGYAAEQTCACLFISGRTLDSCKGDLEPLAQKLVSLHPGDREVTATSFGVSSATARYDENFGCGLTN